MLAVRLRAPAALLGHSRPLSFRAGSALPPFAGHPHLLRTYAAVPAPSRATPPPPVARVRSTPASLPPANGPRSTLPAPIHLPPKPSSGRNFSYLLSIGRVYLTFFKTGLKNTYHNFIASRPIQDRVDRHANGSLAAAVRNAAQGFSREHYQLLLRSRHDVRRIPIFAVIFIVFGELSPLVLPFVSSLVPYTCRVPAQLQRDRKKAQERRRKAFENLGDGVEANRRKQLAELSQAEILHISNVLGLHPKWVPQPLAGMLAAWSVKRWVGYLVLDDTLITRGGGVPALDSGEELLMAASERGIDVLERSEDDIRADLQRYLQEYTRPEDLRPGVWLVPSSEWAKNAASPKKDKLSWAEVQQANRAQNVKKIA